MRFSTCLALVFAGGCAASPATHSAPMAHRAAEKVGVPGRCEDPVPAGGNAEGCYWNASVELGPHGTGLFWQIDRYPDVSSALAAETAQSVVVAFGGRVFLETVTGSASWSGHGEHVATVGPLVVPADVELTARFMQATSSIDEATLPHVHLARKASSRSTARSASKPPRGSTESRRARGPCFRRAYSCNCTPRARGSGVHWSW